MSWEGEDGLQGVTIKEGRAADRARRGRHRQGHRRRARASTIGDTISYLTDAGTFQGTITATVGLGSADSFGGAPIIALDLDTALVHFGADGKVDAIDIQLVDGADVPTVQRAIDEVLPPRTEVITGEEVAEETADAVNEFIGMFGTGLLIFAFITAFVSAFIINNVFQITIGQRLRELALLRAVGASGRQVRRMITLEAFVLGVVATVLGVVGGLLVARLLIAAVRRRRRRVPRAPRPCSLPRTIVDGGAGRHRDHHGLGDRPVTTGREDPARRRDAPRTRLRGDADTSASSPAWSSRSLGVVMFLVGLFVRPGGTPGLIVPRRRRRAPAVPRGRQPVVDHRHAR